MRHKFNIKLHIHPKYHRDIRLFMIAHDLTLEGGLEKAIRVSLKKCESREFREQFIKFPDPPTGADEGTKDHIYWLDHSLKEPVAEMCEIFRQEFGRTTITFGRNAFLYRAINYFMKTEKVAE